MLTSKTVDLARGRMLARYVWTASLIMMAWGPCAPQSVSGQDTDVLRRWQRHGDKIRAPNGIDSDRTYTIRADAAHDMPEMKPLMAIVDKVVYQSNFSHPRSFNKNRKEWQQRQGTRWRVEDGVLRGFPSSPGRQAARRNHKGLEPRIACPLTPEHFIAQLSVRFHGGKESHIVPFVEFGHRVLRLKFDKDGLVVLADGLTLKLAEAKEWKYVPGKWYHILAEQRGDEFVVQFAGGPTLYVKHPKIDKRAAAGSDGLGVVGPVNGVAEIDNVTLWSITSETRADWDTIRDSLPSLRGKQNQQ